MNEKYSIPIRIQLQAYLTNSIPLFDNNQWACVTKADFTTKIATLINENKKQHVADALSLAQAFNDEFTNLTKHKSIRLPLEPYIALITQALRQGKNKVDVFKNLLSNDLHDLLAKYSNQPQLDQGRFNDLTNNVESWLAIKQEQYFNEYDLNYIYHQPSAEIRTAIIDLTINTIRERLLAEGAPSKDVDKFLLQFINHATSDDCIEKYGFEECHGITIDIKDSTPYLTLTLRLPTVFPISEHYASYDSFIKDVPESIEPLLDAAFDTAETFSFEDEGSAYFHPHRIPLLSLKISLDDAGNLFLNGIKYRDDRFIDNLLKQNIPVTRIDEHASNHQILKLTEQGKYQEALAVQQQVNFSHNQASLYRFYGDIIASLPSQVFSFSAPKKILVLINLLLSDKPIENRFLHMEA